MKQNVLVAVLALALGISAVVIVRQLRVIGDLKQAMEDARSRQSVSDKAFLQRASPAESKSKVKRGPAAEPQVAPTATTEAETSAATRKSPSFLANMGTMVKDPAMRGVIRSQQKMSLDMLYGGLFKDLRLTTEQLDAFKELLVDRQMAMMDASLAMMNGETPAADRALKAKELEQIKSSFDTKIGDFLGTDGYGIFKDYEQTQPERMQVNLFKQSLASADALTDEQELDLVQMMHDVRKNTPQSTFTQNTAVDPGQFTEEQMADQLKQLEQMQASALQRATTILSQSQLDQFKKSQEQQRSMMVMGLKMASQMFGQQKAAAPKPAAAAGAPSN